jgi:hypothetical protein
VRISSTCNDLTGFRWLPKFLKSRDRHPNLGLRSWAEHTSVTLQSCDRQTDTKHQTQRRTDTSVPTLALPKEGSFLALVPAVSVRLHIRSPKDSDSEPSGTFQYRSGSDLNLRAMEVNVLRSCVRNRLGKTKTESSRRPVPLHPVVLGALLEWRERSPYATDLDFLFPSVRLKGSRPLSPDSILEKSVRPALARIGVLQQPAIRSYPQLGFSRAIRTIRRSIS